MLRCGNYKLELQQLTDSVPATGHKWTRPPAMQAGTRFTYQEGWKAGLT